jgi:hypothetical protein
MSDVRMNASRLRNDRVLCQYDPSDVPLGLKQKHSVFLCSGMWSSLAAMTAA